MHPPGQPYTWVDGYAPWDHPIADAPGLLVAVTTFDVPPAPLPRLHYLPTRVSAGEAPGRPGSPGAALLEGDG